MPPKFTGVKVLPTAFLNMKNVNAESAVNAQQHNANKAQ